MTRTAFAIIALPFGEYLHSDKGSCGRKLLAADRRQCDSGARQDLRRLCEQRTGQRRRTASGFDEAIFLNENGHVAEGATCNLFMVRDGKLITPPVTENALEGITRNCMMELASREMGLRVIERPIDRSELYICDELFFTGTAVGVAPIVRVDHRPVKDGVIGPVYACMRKLYFDATRGHLQVLLELAHAGLPVTDEARAGTGLHG